MKKILCTFLVLCMLAALAAMGTTASAAQIKVNIPERNALVGDQYCVTVSVADNPGFASLQIELFYNAQVFECVKVTPGDAVKGMLTDANPHAAGEQVSAIFTVAGTSATAKNGTLATFVFTKPGNGSPDLSLSVTEIRAENGAAVPYRVTVDNRYGSTAHIPGADDPAPETTSPTYPAPETTAPSTSGGTVTPPWWSPGTSTTPVIPSTPAVPSTTAVPNIPSQPITPEAEPDPRLSLPAFTENLRPTTVTFRDVPANSWAKPYIDEATSRGLINGYTDGTFKPDCPMTRAEFVTMLWNAESNPTSKVTLPFTDVREGDWYTPQIRWAYGKRYLTGVTTTLCDPGGTVTREQAVTILYRYLGSPEVPDITLRFADRNSVSDYAEDAVRWAVANGILTGTDADHLSPRNTATRAQLCTMMVRCVHYVIDQAKT